MLCFFVRGVFVKRRSFLIFSIVVAAFVLLAVGYRFLSSLADSPGVPEIHFQSEEMPVVSITAGDQELLAGVTATDPEDGDVTASLVVEGISRLNDDSVATVTYAAFDSRNHVTKAERQVRFSDYEPPRFALTDDLIFTVSSRATLLNCVTASDMVDGDLTDRVRFEMLSGSSSMNEVGVYSLQLRVTNSLGGASVLPLTVEITDTNPNSALITLSDYLVYLPQGAAFDPEDYLVSYRAGGTTVDTAEGLSIDNGVNTALPGVYTVTYSYESTATRSRTRLFVVVE